MMITTNVFYPNLVTHLKCYDFYTLPNAAYTYIDIAGKLSFRNLICCIHQCSNVKKTTASFRFFFKSKRQCKIFQKQKFFCFFLNISRHLTNPVVWAERQQVIIGRGDWKLDHLHISYFDSKIIQELFPFKSDKGVQFLVSADEFIQIVKILFCY